MAGVRGGASLMGMSARVALPALLGLVLLVGVGVTTAVRLATRPAPPPLTVQSVRMPLDGSCYVVSATGHDLADPPPAPPGPGSPVDALDAWSTQARATPVGYARVRLTVVAGDGPVTVTGVELNGTTSAAAPQRDWALDPGCRPGPAGRAADGTVATTAVPTVLLAADLDRVATDRRPTPAPEAGGASLPLRVAPHERAHLVLDLTARDSTVRWGATVRWSAGGRSGTTDLRTPAATFTLYSGAQATTHYGWDAAAGRWVDLSSRS